MHHDMPILSLLHKHHYSNIAEYSTLLWLDFVSWLSSLDYGDQLLSGDYWESHCWYHEGECPCRLYSAMIRGVKCDERNMQCSAISNESKINIEILVSWTSMYSSTHTRKREVWAGSAPVRITPSAVFSSKKEKTVLGVHYLPCLPCHVQCTWHCQISSPPLYIM